MSSPAEKCAVMAPPSCPACRAGRLREGARERIFHPHGRKLSVSLLTSVCDQCAAEVISATQHEENLRRLRERKAHYGPLLMGEEIRALRKQYGLTQQQASRIFGKGKIAFSRYESETTYPDETTSKLLALAIAKPDVLKWLADAAGVEIPLWHERCEDEQRVKLRVIFRMPSPKATLRRKENVVAKVEHRFWDASDWAMAGSIRHARQSQMAASNDHEALLEAQGS